MLRAVFLFLFASAAAQAQFIGSNARSGQAVACDKSALLQDAGTGSVQIVAVGTAQQSVRVCAFTLFGSTNATAVNVKFVGGTGANCVTGPADLTPTYNLAASASGGDKTIAHGSGVGQLFKTAPGAALCLNSSAAGATNVHVSYAQF